MFTKGLATTPICLFDLSIILTCWHFYQMKWYILLFLNLTLLIKYKPFLIQNEVLKILRKDTIGWRWVWFI